MRIKLFVLSGISGHAYNFKIYTGEEHEVALGEPDVIQLCSKNKVTLKFKLHAQMNLGKFFYFKLIGLSLTTVPSFTSKYLVVFEIS